MSACADSEIRLAPGEIGSGEPAKLLPRAAVRCFEERRSLGEEKLLRRLSEPVSGKPTPRLVGTRGARGEGRRKESA